jgi:hypothetical protein
MKTEWGSKLISIAPSHENVLSASSFRCIKEHKFPSSSQMLQQRTNSKVLAYCMEQSWSFTPE